MPSLQTPLPPHPPSCTGAGERGLRSVHSTSPLPFLPPHTLAPAWVLPTGCCSCWEKLLQHELSTVCSSSREYPAALVWGLPGCSVDIGSGVFLSASYREIPAPPQFLPWAAGEPLIQHLEHLLPCFLLRPWCSQGSHTSFFLSFLICSSLLGSVLPFLKHLFPEVPPAWLRVSAVPCGGSCWSQLELAVSGTGQLPLPAPGYLRLIQRHLQLREIS